MPTRDEYRQEKQQFDQNLEKHRQFMQSDEYKTADQSKRERYDRLNDAAQEYSQALKDLDQD